MPAYTVLDRDAHRHLRITTGPEVRFGSAVPFVAVVPAEFARIAAHHALFLRRNPRSGRLEPVAMLGFRTGENLFLTRGGWATPHIPLEFQRQPFRMVPGPDGALVLGFDGASPRVQRGGGEALFLADGADSDYLERVRDMVARYTEGLHAAQAYSHALGELELIAPAPIEVRFADGTEMRIVDLYTIDRDRFDALDAATVIGLRDAGWLELIYLQMASRVQVANLVARRDGLFR
jgi:hypothetical protein